MIIIVIIVVVDDAIDIIMIIQVNLGYACLSNLCNVSQNIIYKRSINNL